MSLRDIILAAKDTALKAIEVVEWGCTVFVPVTTLAEAPDLQAAAAAGPAGFAKLAAFIIRDETGARVFTEADAEALAGKSLSVIQRIVDEYNRLNGHTTEEPAAKK